MNLDKSIDRHQGDLFCLILKKYQQNPLHIINIILLLIYKEVMLMNRMERRRQQKESKKEKAMITIAVTNVITAILNFLKALLG